MKRTGDACLVLSFKMLRMQSMRSVSYAGSDARSTSNGGKGVVTMFALRGATTPLGQARRQRNSPALPVLAVFTLCTLLIILSGCGTPATSNRNNALTSSATQVGTSFSASVRQVRARVVPAPSITTAVYTAQRRLYTFSTTNVGLMQPAVDAQDNVWIGEMHSNLFGRLDTHTGVVTTWTPPGGQYGIMTSTIDAQGNIWFAEQIANYIGRFDPRQQTFRIFSLGTWQGNPTGATRPALRWQGLVVVYSDGSRGDRAIGPQDRRHPHLARPVPHSLNPFISILSHRRVRWAGLVW